MNNMQTQSGVPGIGQLPPEMSTAQRGTKDDDRLMLEAMHRKKLALLELAEAVGRLEARGMSHEEIGQRIGLTRRYIDDLGNLLRLGEPLRQQMRAGRLGVKAAAAWARVLPEHQEALAQMCADVDVTGQQARTIAEMLNSGWTVAAAAEAAGCAPAAVAAGENAGPVVGQAESKQVRKPRSTRVLGAVASGDLLRVFFPELEPRAVQSLAETAARRQMPERELKAAGCFAAAGAATVEALDRARVVSGRLWMCKVMMMLDLTADLEALCTGDHCPPEAAQVFPILVRRVGAIKSLARGAGSPAKGAKAPAAARALGEQR